MPALVSIVMPSYNTGRFIEATVRSVMAQTYKNWELIVVDDCSTDGTMDVLSKLCHPERNDVESMDLASRIHIFQNEKNSGAAVSRNRAIREARGKYIAFLDSDDLWAPDKLEKQVRFMEENGYGFTYTKYSEIDENGEPLGVTVSGPACIGKTGMYNYCWLGCLTVMYNRETVGDIQIEDIRKNNDYALWLKVIRKSKCRLLPEVLASYRKRGGSISNHSYITLIKWHYKLYNEAEGLNPITSLWITARNLVFGVYKKIKYVGRG